MPVFLEATARVFFENFVSHRVNLIGIKGSHTSTSLLKPRPRQIEGIREPQTWAKRINVEILASLLPLSI